MLICEWKDRLGSGTYDLWVQPRNNGNYYEPGKVESLFTLHSPLIRTVEEIEGENDKLVCVKVTGLYFSISPKVYVFYRVVKNGTAI